MRIIRNYALRECVLPFLIALAILNCVFLLGNLIQLTHMVINKGVSLGTVGRVFALYVPVLLGYTLPIACLVSIMLGFSRLSADNEILAMRACGIQLKSLLLPLTIVGLMLSLAAFILNDRIVPYAHHEQRKLLSSLSMKNPTALLEPGVFITAFKDQVLFIHKIEGNRMSNITIYQPQGEGKPTRTIIASKGEFTTDPEKNQVLLKLIHGTSDEPDLKRPDNFYKLNFETFFLTLDLPKDDKKIEKKPRSMSLRELREEKVRMERLLVDTGRLEAEYFRKITWSLAPLSFVLLGFPLAVITNRREKSANVLLAVIFAGVYYLLSLGCEALSIEQVIPAAVIMWFPNLAALTMAGILNYKICTR